MTFSLWKNKGEPDGLEKKLREENARNEAIFYSMNEGLIVMDREFKIVLMNRAASVMLRTAPLEAVGQDIKKVLRPCLVDGKFVEGYLPVEQALEGELLNVTPEDGIYFRNKAGQEFPVAMMLSPLFNKEGKHKIVQGAVIVFRNAAQEKSLDEARMNFISIASHQMRTPLTSVKWFLEMLLDGDAGPLNKEQKYFVDTAYKGLDRMVHLVNMLLRIARIEAGRLPMEPRLLNIKDITLEVVSVLKHEMKLKAQKVEIGTKPDPFPLALICEERVWQVIQNLISNAGKYSPRQSIISVSIELKGDLIEYLVTDHGIGIPRNQQDRVFERFFRADNSVKIDSTGSGLGLSLAKSLVESWGGKMWFESEEGRGTIFHFTIPKEGMRKMD